VRHHNLLKCTQLAQQHLFSFPTGPRQGILRRNVTKARQVHTNSGSEPFALRDCLAWHVSAGPLHLADPGWAEQSIHGNEAQYPVSGTFPENR
jgi:hypothetical protein